MALVIRLSSTDPDSPHAPTTRCTGDSPVRYVTRCRLARAARQLRMSRAGLAEIALLAGYESEFSFSRAFKRAFGVAPRAFREQDDESTAMNEFLAQRRADG